MNFIIGFVFQNFEFDSKEFNYTKIINITKKNLTYGFI